VLIRPDLMVTQAIDLLVDYLKGKKVEPLIYISTEKVTIDNAQACIDKSTTW